MPSFDPGYGQTEVSEEEREALTPYALSVLGDPPLKSDLYDVEQALQDHVGDDLVGQIRSGSLSPDEILTDFFVRELHRRLYGSLWEWGGKFRLTVRRVAAAAGSWCCRG